MRPVSAVDKHVKKSSALQITLISTYELGRQPFGLASPAAWLRRAGAQVECIDLAVEPLREDAVRKADLVAFYLPMHLATRMAAPALARIRELNPTAHLCCFGLYAAENAAYLRTMGVETILGGEFESGLAALAERLAEARPEADTQPAPIVSLDRQQFLKPDRSGLPPLDRYAKLVRADGTHAAVGYTEASRGCKHRCRHCPIVPVYNGRFRVVQREVVLDDIRQQVAAGAQHITFGDPDFFNGIGHAIPLVEALHAEFPALSYDVTIKVEHLLKHADDLPTLQRTGCLFVTSAVESFDDETLAIFEKRHTKRDVERALQLCRAAGLALSPTFVAFTPWTTIESYRKFLAEIARLGLVDQVAPAQYGIRLLIPPGSRLLELPEVRALVGPFDEPSLAYPWRNPDPRVETLCEGIRGLIQQTAVSRRALFEQLCARAGVAPQQPTTPSLPSFTPYLTEPWYC